MKIMQRTTRATRAAWFQRFWKTSAYAGRLEQEVPAYLFKDDLLKMKWPGYDSLWHYLDKKVLNTMDSRGVVLGVLRDDLVEGLAYEMLRFPNCSRYVQYFDGAWHDYDINSAVIMPK